MTLSRKGNLRKSLRCELFIEMSLKACAESLYSKFDL